MEFLHPWLVLGLLGVAVPVAVHIISRRRPREVPLPTVRFLSETLDPDRDVTPPRDLLMLLARALAVALFAILLARPLLPDAGASERAMRVALVLDDSYSTGARAPGGGEGAFERLRDAADALLSRLPEGSEAALVRVSGGGIPGGPGPTGASDPEAAWVRDLAGLRHSLALAVPSSSGEPLASALGHATRLAGPGGTVVVLSDGTRRAFHEAASAAGGLARGVRLTLALAGPPPQGNARLLPPEVEPARPGAGTAVRLAFRALGLDAPRRLRLQVEGAEAQTRLLSPDLSGQGAASVEWVFPRPGVYQGQASLEGQDPLALDDTVYFTLRVEAPPTVLVVAPPAGTEDGAFFLAHALAPGRAAAAADVARAEPEDLATEPLEGYQAVFLVDWPDPTPADWARLEAYVARGGALGVFAGARTDPARYAAAPAPALLAALPGSLVATPEGRRAVVDDEEERAGGPRRRWAAAGLTSARFLRYRVLEARPEADPVVVWFDAGHPALVTRPVGEGRVLVAGFGLTGADGDLVRGPAFVPVVHTGLRLLLAHQARRTGYIVGERTEARPGAGRATAPGHVRLGTPSGEEVAWSVNVDPLEGDLGPISASELEALFPGAARLDPARLGDLAARLHATSARREATPWLAAAFALVYAALPFAVRRRGRAPGPA
ncbi:MAG: BatA domain-containing protein [Planctomycetes bacterium]|nr:BatA domain-containing protein [Planctomycetota bacterium]